VISRKVFWFLKDKKLNKLQNKRMNKFQNKYKNQI